MLEGVAPYLTLPPVPGSSGRAAPPLPRSWTHQARLSDPTEGNSEDEIEMREFSPCPDAALSVCPMSDTLTPTSPTPTPPLKTAEEGDGGGDWFLWPQSVSRPGPAGYPNPLASRSSGVPVEGLEDSVSVGPAGYPNPLARQSSVFPAEDLEDSVSLGAAGYPNPLASRSSMVPAEGLEDSVSLGPTGDRADPDGEAAKIHRSASLSEVRDVKLSGRASFESSSRKIPHASISSAIKIDIA